MTAIHLGIWEHSSSYIISCYLSWNQILTFGKKYRSSDSVHLTGGPIGSQFTGSTLKRLVAVRGSWKECPPKRGGNKSVEFYWSDDGCGLRSFVLLLEFFWGERWSRRSLPAKHKDCGWFTIKMIQMIQQFLVFGFFLVFQIPCEDRCFGFPFTPPEVRPLGGWNISKPKVLG